MAFLSDEDAKKAVFAYRQKTGREMLPAQFQEALEYAIDVFQIAFEAIGIKRSREWIKDFIVKNRDDIFEGVKRYLK